MYITLTFQCTYVVLDNKDNMWNSHWMRVCKMLHLRWGINEDTSVNQNNHFYQDIRPAENPKIGGQDYFQQMWVVLYWENAVNNQLLLLHYYGKCLSKLHWTQTYNKIQTLCNNHISSMTTWIMGKIFQY